MGLLDGLGVALLQRRPDLLRLLAGIFVRKWPLPSAGRTIFVLRDDDVRNVLSRDDDFELGSPNAPKMLCGDFLLGMDPVPQYREEKAALRGALEAAKPHFATVVDEVCRSAADDAWNALPRARHVPLEVVGAYAEKVTTLASAEFYGIPVKGVQSAVLRGDDFEVFRQHLRKLGGVIGTRHPAPFGLHAVAKVCAEELVGHVEGVVRERIAMLERYPAAARGSVLDQLIVRRYASAADLDVAGVARNVIGLMLAGSAAITLSFVRVLDQFLQRPEVLERAIAAARQGDLGTLTLRELAEEAMRFHPTFPALPRYCPRATTLAAGTPREREIPAGTSLLVITASAMFDPLALHEPEVFRPARKYEHLHFGSGTHWCLGDEFAMAELVAMLRHFLERPWTLRRRRGQRIRYDGIAVDRYVIDAFLPETGART